MLGMQNGNSENIPDGTDSFLPSCYLVLSHPGEVSGSMAVNQGVCRGVGGCAHARVYVCACVGGGSTQNKRKKIPGMSLRGESSKTGPSLRNI